MRLHVFLAKANLVMTWTLDFCFELWLLFANMGLQHKLNFETILIRSCLQYPRLKCHFEKLFSHNTLFSFLRLQTSPPTCPPYLFPLIYLLPTTPNTPPHNNCKPNLHTSPIPTNPLPPPRTQTPKLENKSAFFQTVSSFSRLLIFSFLFLFILFFHILC